MPPVAARLILEPLGLGLQFVQGVLDVVRGRVGGLGVPFAQLGLQPGAGRRGLPDAVRQLAQGLVGQQADLQTVGQMGDQFEHAARFRGQGRNFHRHRAEGQGREPGPAALHLGRVEGRGRDADLQGAAHKNSF